MVKKEITFLALLVAKEHVEEPTDQLSPICVVPKPKGDI